MMLFSRREDSWNMGTSVQFNTSSPPLGTLSAFPADSGLFPPCESLATFIVAEQMRTDTESTARAEFCLTALTDRNRNHLDFRRAASMNLTSRHFSVAAEGTGQVAKHDTYLNLTADD